MGKCTQKTKEILQRGLTFFKLTEEDLKGLKKNDWRKPNIALEIRKKTIMNAKWLSEYLQMGNRTGVFKSIRRYKDERETGDTSKKPRFSA